MVNSMAEGLGWDLGFCRTPGKAGKAAPSMRCVILQLRDAPLKENKIVMTSPWMHPDPSVKYRLSRLASAAGAEGTASLAGCLLLARCMRNPCT